MQDSIEHRKPARVLLLGAFPRSVKCSVQSEVIPGVLITLMDTEAQTLAALEQRVLPRLHPAEQQRYETFTHPLRRQTWLAGRALLLASLQRQLGLVNVAALRTDPDGGVRYSAADLRLSLSHSGELIAVALSRRAVGVDIEWSRPRKLLQRPGEVFSSSEAARLQALPESQRQDAFYTLWTLKEAACKAAGLSLWECLRSTSFDPANAAFSAEPPFPAGNWRFVSMQFSPHWFLGLATVSSLPIEIRRLDAPDQWQPQTLSGQIELRQRQ